MQFNAEVILMDNIRIKTKKFHFQVKVNLIKKKNNKMMKMKKKCGEKKIVTNHFTWGNHVGEWILFLSFNISEFSNNFQPVFFLSIRFRIKCARSDFSFTQFSSDALHTCFTHTLANEIRNCNNNFKKTRFQSISNSWNNSLTNRVQFLFWFLFFIYLLLLLRMFVTFELFILNNNSKMILFTQKYSK